ncbi:hypothetical protein Scep_022568 [Stephania cephalantha]|uniref:Uncharacterized protein n=1 Tax=Stephania cephalantha TaxID=152367 RepID=A0AAP0F6G5_9MAGN
MVEGKGSSLVYLMVVVLSLVAFGFAIAAERRRSTVSLEGLIRLDKPDEVSFRTTKFLELNDGAIMS